MRKMLAHSGSIERGAHLGKCPYEDAAGYPPHCPTPSNRRGRRAISSRVSQVETLRKPTMRVAFLFQAQPFSNAVGLQIVEQSKFVSAQMRDGLRMSLAFFLLTPKEPVCHQTLSVHQKRPYIGHLLSEPAKDREPVSVDITPVV